MLIDGLLAELDERHIAQAVTIPIDEARNRFPLHSNTVNDFHEFDSIITDFFNYLFTTCVSHGGALSASEASSRAKELLEREYRKKNGDIVMAFNDACAGTNGAMRNVLDIITEGVKSEAVENHIRHAFDTYVAPNDWMQKVAIIKQFITRCGPYLSSSIRTDQLERYAHNYLELLRSYCNALEKTSSIFRRL
jgi:hypothetical protein